MNSTVELQDGKVEIDGLDISQIELNVLRNRLALVPQDATLFLGTLRDNLYDSLYNFLLVD
jgi:ATP-binding cassette subfamily C (CFTR/MRP) protein 1